ncbi:MAG: extracellular solute-binding protein, partial [Tagaea sp.]|nr:extracellular solute-binding protein [Tagaea sp.]
MKRRTFLASAGATLAAPALVNAQAPATVRWWYHFDNPQHSPAELVAAFERANPGIRIQAESIPWGGGNDYYTRLYAAIVANNAPDCAMVKLANMSRLLEMRALEPLDPMLGGWAGASDIADSLWNLH